MRFKGMRWVAPTLFCTLLCFILVLQVTAQDVYSANKRYQLVTDHQNDQTIIYSTAGSQQEEFYTIPGTLNHAFISDNGRYVASCKRWLSKGSTKGFIAQFYDLGEPVRSLPVKSVLKKPKSLQREGSRYRWGLCIGFVDDYHFEVYTVENERLFVNIISGDISSESPTPSNVNVHVHEVKLESVPKPDLCKHDGHVFCDRFVEYNPGWRQVRGKWEYDTDEVKDRLLHQSSDRGKEGNALMYFDNLVLADSDISTVLRMGFDMPQTVIDEDKARIRIMRRIAGAGLVFRLQDENNFYMFRLAGEEGAVLGKMVAGEWFDLVNPRAEHFLGEGRFQYGKKLWYKLRVRVRGDRIQAWIGEWVREGDGWNWREQAVVNLVDKEFSTGRVGLTTFHVAAQFSALRIDGL